MARATKQMQTDPDAVEIVPVQFLSLRVRIIGQTPLILHAMSAKAKEQLMLGGRKKTAAERAASIKHDPYAEFVSGLIRARPGGPTALAFPATAFKQAMAYATRATVGVAKVDILSMCQIVGFNADLYGVPKLRMDVVRSADMRRTPDIRTRPVLERWGCELAIEYVASRLSANVIVALLANAGRIAGVGDWRPEKGGSFGRFDVATADEPNEAWTALLAEGRAAQELAIASPDPFDDDTRQLMAIYDQAVTKRR